MNQLSGAEAFVRMLQLHGVTHIFGLCGDTSLPFYDALFRLDHGMKHILTRDERCAAYMADAYARVTGKVGICEGPSGGGATYILPGVVEANESSIPVLAITTDIAVSSRGRFALTELDQEGLFRPLTKFTSVLDRAREVPRTVRAAFRHMTTGRPGAAHIGFPFDVQRAPVDESDVWADEALGSFPARRAAPEPAAVTAAAEAILSAKEPLIICGGGPVIAGAEAQVLALAELLEAPVATTVSGQGVIAEDHPLAVGVVGSNGGSLTTRAIVKAADLVIFIGCRAGSVTTEGWKYPEAGVTRVVHIDVDPNTIGVNFETEAAIVADARLALEVLVAEIGGSLKGTPRREMGRAAVARAREEKFAAFRKLAQSEKLPIRPERIIADLQSVLPRDAIIVADPGTPCPYFSAFYDFLEPGRKFITNRAHGALGYALPAAVGACFGRPEAKVVSVMGDGSFGFSVGELETIVRYNLPITMVVVSNSVFGWIKAGQKTSFSKRYFSVDFNRSDHARIAEAFGVTSWRVENPEYLRSVLAKAVATDGPTLVDVISQPLHEAKAPVSKWIS
jgi:acetolactate synthase I/II/III large subunit